MGKKNAWLEERRANNHACFMEGQYCNERQCLDTIIMTLNREFGFGKSRIDKFIDSYIVVRRETAERYLDDRYKNGDKEFVYSSEKVDRELRQIMGDDYPCHKERYTFDMRKSFYEGGIRIK